MHDEAARIRAESGRKDETIADMQRTTDGLATDLTEAKAGNDGEANASI